MKKLGVCGHLAYGSVSLDGQTIKTKYVVDELIKVYDRKNMKIVDTFNWKRNPFKLLMNCFFLFGCKNIIIMPDINGIKVFSSLFLMINLFFRRKLHYVVIGGWIPQLVEVNKKLKKRLQKFDKIYVETTYMKSALEKQGFRNVLVMPNCKELTQLKPEDLIYTTSEPFKLCTFSRVMKEKGIEDAVKVVSAINDEKGKIVYELDIYGQIDANQIEWFECLKKDFPSFINYKGLVPYDASVDVLKNYYMLLFPTYYETEGFAGTLIDAFAAGLPIIATDWNNNNEIIDSSTGFLYNLNEDCGLRNRLLYALDNSVQINKMKEFCLQKSKLYTPSQTIKILVSQIV